MAINPLQIPGGFQSPSLDWSSLAQLGTQYKQAQADQMRQQTLASLGQGPLDAAAAQKLIASGDLSLANLGVGLANTNYQHGRDSANDAWRREEAARAQQNADRSFGIQQRSADRADAVADENSPSGRAKTAGSYGLAVGTPEFKAYVLNGKLPEGNTTVEAQTAQREAAAARIGLRPEHPAYQSFILTGKMPREDAQPLTATDKKAIIEADEAVLSNKAAIDSLGRATKLSKEAFYGPTAGVRGYAASFLGQSSDTGRAGIATEQLTNEVEANALSQLKAIFGGAPTEGERKILLDIQGSAKKSPEVREEIYKRAQNAAQVRLDFNQKRADELRGGQFYKPQGSMSRAPVAQSQGITQAQYEALPSGSPFTAPDGTQRIKP